MNLRQRNIILFVTFIIYLIGSTLVSLGALEGFIGSFSMFASFDEIYSIREVQNILDSASLKELFLNIIAGNGYIYGRLIYFINAIICFIPYHNFGVDGLVFTMRIAQCICLFIGFWLLISYTVKNYSSQLFALLVLLVFPITLYFMGAPKPEPLQILLIALFFKFHKKYNWSWLFLGLALGTKVSISFSVLFLGLAELYAVIKTKDFKRIWENGLWALFGLLIALPGLFFAIFFPAFRNGLINIVASTKKPYDDPSITFITWLNKWMSYFSEMPVFVSYALMGIVLTASIWFLIKRTNKTTYIIFAFAALLPVMLMTKRLWGHYLFLGTAMLLPLVFEFIDQLKLKKYVKPIVFTLFFIQVIYHTNGILKAKGELESEKEIAIKNKTLNMIEEAKKLEISGQIGVDLSLYYNYSWIKNDQILTANKNEFDHLDILILPINHEYKLPENSVLWKTQNGLLLYTK